MKNTTIARNYAEALFLAAQQGPALEQYGQLLDAVAGAVQALLDVKLNRVHAGVTLAAVPDARLEKQIVERLGRALGREVRAHFRSDRGILGGVVVRVGDRVFDGSLRRRVAALRRQLLAGE